MCNATAMFMKDTRFINIHFIMAFKNSITKYYDWIIAMGGFKS